MKKFLLLLTVSVLFSISSFAQEKAQPDSIKFWKTNLKMGLNLNQASFSDNWTGGGVNSIGFNTLLNFKANYKKGKHSWDNEVGLLYGLQKNDGESTKKTNDRILLDSKYGYSFSPKWNAYFSVNFLSQFDKGYSFDTDANGLEQRTLISSFLSPGFLTTSWGVEFKPQDYFSLRISPISPRFTFVTDTTLYQTVPDNYGVEVGKKVRTEWLAFQILADFDHEIAKNLNLKAKYLLFWNYELPLDESDHRIDLLLEAKVNKFLAVSLGGIMLYDRDQSAQAQFSQLFALGLTYEYNNHKK